jgi:catechol 2,3-dioxygenase-like lactoylglutathione lyase family enzyme
MAPPDQSPSGKKRPAPVRISEIILHTVKFEAMKAWYGAALGIEPTVLITIDPAFPMGDIKRVCFYRVHMDFPYTQVVGLFELPHLDAMPPGRVPGLDHMQLRCGSMAELFERYDLLKADGVRPNMSMNHGPGTSFYYTDPDGNTVEFSANNFKTEADYFAFFQTPQYLRNFAGLQINPEAYIARYRSGVSLEELVQLP